MNRAFFYTVAGGSAILPDPVWEQTGVWISSATLVVSSAWTMSAVTISAGNTQFIYNRGVALECTLSGGRVNISAGGICNSMSVYTGMTYVYGGGAASSVVISGNAGITVYTDGYVQGLELVAVSARITISNGGRASEVTVGASGLVYVSNGGSAVDIAVSAGGRLYVYSGGIATDVYVSGAGAAVYISSAGLLSSATVINNLFILTGGSAQVIDTVGAGRLQISSGGVATSMTVSSTGRIYISSGGYGESATVGQAGGMWSFNGGSAAHVVVQSGGSLTLSAGGWCANCTISSGGRFIMSSNTVASNITVSSGATMDSPGNGAVISGLTLRTNTPIVRASSGTVVVSAVVGNTPDIPVESRATLIAANSGIISGITYLPGGYGGAANGGSMLDVIFSGSYMSIGSGAYVSGFTDYASAAAPFTINGGCACYNGEGRLLITNYATTAGSSYISGWRITTPTSGLGNRLIYCTAEAISVASGVKDVAIWSNAYVSGIEVFSEAAVGCAGFISVALVEAGGTLTISSGGTAFAVTSNAGAIVNVLEGGSITYA